MSNFPDYIFLKLTQAFCKCHWKTQNDKKYIHGAKEHEVGGD
jgi:hypothetical protein